MQNWLAFERRWCQALLEAMIPSGERQPGIAAVDMAPFWPRFQAAAPPLLRHGLRASVWLLTWLPLIWPGCWRTFGGLNDERRDRFLVAVAGSRFFLLRQVVLAVKLVACLAGFHGPAVRIGLDARLAESVKDADLADPPSDAASSNPANETAAS